MSKVLTGLLIPFALVAPAAGSHLKPIPPDIWNLKEATLPEGKGALILSKRIRVEPTFMEFHYLIRICSERGKEAAEFPAFPEDAYELEGRTVQPDGSQTTYSSRTDFVSREGLSTRNWDIRKRLLAPPGLTADCAVELHWKEPRYWLGWKEVGRRHQETLELAEDLPVDTLTLEVAPRAPFSWALKGASSEGATQTKSSEGTTLVLKRIKSLEDPPYSVRGTLDLTRFRAWTVGSALQAALDRGKPAFWEEFTRQHKEYFTGGIGRGKGYRAFSEEIRANLPPSLNAQATELMLRLDARIRNLGVPTFQELASSSKADLEKLSKSDPKDLAGAVARGSATREGMLFLYLQLLQDAGIKPRLVLAVDRERGVFDPLEANPGQFHDCIVGVEEPGKGFIWVDPTLRFATPGIIQPAYQGTRALEIDMATWTSRPIDLPFQPAAANQRYDTYRLELLPDQDVFTLESRFTGYDEWAERDGYLALEPREQNRKLLESLEARSRTVAVDQAEVQNAVDPRNNVSWTASGRIERAAGRRRIVDPFPLTSLALALPEVLTEPRVDPITLNHKTLRRAVCRFKLPEGYDLAPFATFNHANPFGKVILQVSVAKGEVTAVLVVELALGAAPATQWPAFKEFAAWIEEAQNAVLVLEKPEKKVEVKP